MSMGNDVGYGAGIAPLGRGLGGQHAHSLSSRHPNLGDAANLLI